MFSFRVLGPVLGCVNEGRDLGYCAELHFIITNTIVIFNLILHLKMNPISKMHLQQYETKTNAKLFNSVRR